MATTTITAIPHNGGTLSVIRKELCSVTLTPSKTVNFYAQSNPNLVYAHVVNTVGLNGSVTAESTNGPQFAFGANGARVRAIRMSDTRMFVLLGSDLVVFEVAADDTITQKAGILPNFNANSIGLWYGSTILPANSEQTDSMLVGSVISGTRLSDTSAAYATRPDSSNGPSLRRVNYNTTTEALTITTITTGFSGTYWNTSAAGNGAHCDIRFSDIPNSSNKLMYFLWSSNNTNTSRAQNTPSIMSAMVIDQNAQFIKTLVTVGGQFVSGYTSSNQPIHALVALSDSLFLGFLDGKSVRVITNSTPAAPSNTPPASSSATTVSGAVLTFATSGAQSMVTDAVALNSSYVMFTMTDPVPTNYLDAANMKLKQQYLRIFRYVDANFAEVVSSTETYTSNALGFYLNFDGDYGLEKVDDTTYLFKSKLNGTATDARINIRSIVAGSQ